MKEWFIYIPEEGDWLINYDGDDPAEARVRYLKEAGRERLPAGSHIWTGQLNLEEVSQVKSKTNVVDVAKALIAVGVEMLEGFEGFDTEEVSSVGVELKMLAEDLASIARHLSEVGEAASILEELHRDVVLDEYFEAQ